MAMQHQALTAPMDRAMTTRSGSKAASEADVVCLARRRRDTAADRWLKPANGMGSGGTGMDGVYPLRRGNSRIGATRHGISHGAYSRNPTSLCHDGATKPRTKKAGRYGWERGRWRDGMCSPTAAMRHAWPGASDKTVIVEVLIAVGTC